MRNENESFRHKLMRTRTRLAAKRLADAKKSVSEAFAFGKSHGYNDPEGDHPDMDVLQDVDTHLMILGRTLDRVSKRLEEEASKA